MNFSMLGLAQNERVWLSGSVVRVVPKRTIDVRASWVLRYGALARSALASYAFRPLTTE